MTHEETIKRIQELVPSIMELEFGCEVKILIYHTVNSRSSGTYWRKHRVIAIHHPSGDLILNRVGRYGNKKISRSSQMQIIGKPITISIVLRAIGESSQHFEYITFSNEYISMVYKKSDKLIQWNLSKDNFNDQSEETKTFIGVLLGNNSKED